MTFYFKVRGKNIDNEMRHQSSLTEKETLAGKVWKLLHFKKSCSKGAW